jgi:hypothetical protein
MIARALRSFFSWALPTMGVDAEFFMDTRVFSAVTRQSLVDHSASGAKYHLALDLRTLNEASWVAEGCVTRHKPKPRSARLNNRLLRGPTTGGTAIAHRKNPPAIFYG